MTKGNGLGALQPEAGRSSKRLLATDLAAVSRPVLPSGFFPTHHRGWARPGEEPKGTRRVPTAAARGLSMAGSRRVRTTSALPRCGPPCLFKGHLSTKSNAFCIDSSSLRLTTLQMIKNHMAVHYNKILSAKAAVDCSVPISMSASIKYADQQRREKLKKELARCEREFKLTQTAMQANSKRNHKSFFNTVRKSSGDLQDQAMLIEEVTEFPSFAQAFMPSSETLQLSVPKSDKILTSCTEKNSWSSPSSMDYTASDPRNLRSGAAGGRRPRSAFPNSHRFQFVISKAPNGDLLEKHSELFSNSQLPFTPRTLKTEAKSFLSQYRYYTPAKRKKNFTDQQTEAETQTELSSFNSDFGTSETKTLTDLEENRKQASNCLTYRTEEKVTPLWDKNKDSALQHPSKRTFFQYSTHLPSENKIYSNEEELLYLSFIEDVTSEILKLGLFSNRFLEQLFERHIKQNKHHLEEEKMRHLLHSLKIDLGCPLEENPVKLSDADMWNVLDFRKPVDSEQNELKHGQDLALQQERQQYQRALDMLLSAPKDEQEVLSSQSEFFMPVYKSKCSEGVIIQQLNDETNLEPLAWDENHLSISDSLRDQETSVSVIGSDSDTEHVDLSSEFSGLCTALSKSVHFSSVRSDSDHDQELPSLTNHGNER
ncbi:spermatogenesis-associated protein 7 [Ctenodactylus gundi]